MIESRWNFQHIKGLEEQLTNKKMNIKDYIRTTLYIIGRVICYNNNSKVLYYHDVCGTIFYKSPDTDVLQGTPIEIFKKHINIIKQKGYAIVPKISKKKYEVSIMFDDGYRGIWDNRQFFYDNGIKPTVFLAVELIGKPSFLSKDEILELQKHGFVFECHSWSHVSLGKLSAEALKKELGDSKEFLSKLLGKEVTEICLPLGHYSDILISELKNYDYKVVYSSVPGNSSEKVEGFMETRNFCQSASPFDFKMILDGGLSIFKKRYMRLHYQ